MRQQGLKSQFGALCFRIKAGKTEILLITSRGTKRWILPKGWPIKGCSPAEGAAVEAFEEAGVEGKMQPVCVGIYAYDKIMEDAPSIPCLVAIYPLRVKKLLRKYPESGQRRRKWFSRKRAAALVDEPELSEIILNFDPAGFDH